jgi:hypothetical protein
MHFIYDFCILSMFFLVSNFNKYSFGLLKQLIELKPFQFSEQKTPSFNSLKQ